MKIKFFLLTFSLICSSNSNIRRFNAYVTWTHYAMGRNFFLPLKFPHVKCWISEERSHSLPEGKMQRHQVKARKSLSPLLRSITCARYWKEPSASGASVVHQGTRRTCGWEEKSICSCYVLFSVSFPISESVKLCNNRGGRHNARHGTSFCA